MNDNESSVENKNARRRLVLTYLSIGCIIVLSVGLFVNKMLSPHILSVKELVKNGAITYQEPKTLLPFQLLDHNGNVFDPSRLKGHWTLMFFGYTHCPDFCPATLAILKAFVADLDEASRTNLQVVMVSVDPPRDTLEQLKNYMTTFNPNFIGVTGDIASIKLLADQLYIPFHSHPSGMPTSQQNQVGHDNDTTEQLPNHEENYTVAHGENIALINPEGKYQGFFKPPFTRARLKATYHSIVATYTP